MCFKYGAHIIHGEHVGQWMRCNTYTYEKLVMTEKLNIREASYDREAEHARSYIMYGEHICCAGVQLPK